MHDNYFRVWSLAIAGIVLGIGILVYLFDRQATQVYFMAPWLVPDNQIQSVFGALGHSLPSFVHVYAFILLTALFVIPSRTRWLGISLAWAIIDAGFELAQIDVVADWIALQLPDWFRGVPVLENTAVYFQAGTFDVLDLMAIIIGSITACLTLYIISMRTRRSPIHV